MDDLPTSFGKYFLTEKIATGGMAEIFLAKLIGPGGFEKPLIIKQIHPELSGERQFVDMFVTEAKILVSLSHGHIVPVYELGVIDDTYFIAMEYIDGPTLRMLQKALARDRAAMAPACAGFIMARVLEGLSYAHRKGVIHRDLSPHNVMVSREGEVKLVDFGIAVREEHLQGAKGKLVGSYPYMSPEQVRGLELTPKSDLFSAGILFWELLAGQSLFKRADAKATLRAVESAPIEPPSAKHPEVPEELERVCLRALERDPDARFESAGGFLAALNRYLYAREQPVSEIELSRLVARHCPPEVPRSAPSSTAHEREPERGATGQGGHTVPMPGRAAPSESDAPERTRPLPRPAPTTEHADEAPGEHTRPVPGRARGKRAPTVRTFATREEFKHILERATPLVPLPAITEAEVPDATQARPGEPESKRGDQTAESEESDRGERTGEAGEASEPAAARSRTAIIALIALVVLAAGAGAAVIVLGGPFGGANQRSDEAAHITTTDAASALASPSQPSDARSPALDAPLEDAAGPVADPRGHDPPGDTGTDTDNAAARTKPPRPTREDAGTLPPGTLKVGANPWAEVYLDGRLLGRAPNSWPVPPGRHTVDVTFPVAGREQERRFSIEVRPGQETSLGVIDFSTSP